jgi:hypothetical protein
VPAILILSGDGDICVNIVVNVPLNVEALRVIYVVEVPEKSANTDDVVKMTVILSPVTTADPCAGEAPSAAVSKICCWRDP